MSALFCGKRWSKVSLYTSIHVLHILLMVVFPLPTCLYTFLLVKMLSAESIGILTKNQCDIGCRGGAYIYIR